MVFGVNFLHAQSVEFQLQRLSPCDSIPVVEDQYYYLTDIPYDVTDEGYSNSESDVITVPKPGKYLVYRTTEPDMEPYEVNLSPGLMIETVQDPKIMLRLSYSIDPYFYYETCGKPSQGYDEDYYLNGNIRIRGTFENGKVNDSIAEYYSNGAPKRKEFHKRKGIFTTLYDSLGRKEHFRWSARGNCSVSFCSYKEIWYDSGESVAYEISNIDHIIKFKEHYPDRSLRFVQKRNSRVEYYRNGIIKNEWTWRSRKNKHGYAHYVKHKEFDVNGKLVSEKLDEEANSDFPQPQIAYEYSNPLGVKYKCDNTSQPI